MKPTSLFARLALMWCLVLALPGCIDPYTPDIISAPHSYLVVDGFINSRGITRIKLSRTFPITTSSVAKAPIEKGAALFIEGENGARYRLQESPLGTYSSPALVLASGSNYRLFITTVGMAASQPATETYASDYTPAKTTPPIDSVPWQAESAGVGIYINAHDDTNATRYYRWEFDETWEIIPPYRPVLEYANGRVRPITVRFPTICWGNEISSAIQISKTTALTRDVVANFPIRRLPILSPRIYQRYSILVKQYALSKAEYEYWELLRKNTESIGSLFDPQPSQVTGNVHCLTNPGEVVLGFVGVHSVEEKRIFISRPQLPNQWRVGTGYERCVPPDTIETQYTSPEMAFGGGNVLPIDAIPKGYIASSVDCIDCRTRGTATKPSFW